MRGRGDGGGAADGALPRELHRHQAPGRGAHQCRLMEPSSVILDALIVFACDLKFFTSVAVDINVDNVKVCSLFR